MRSQTTTFRHPKYTLLTPGTSQPKMAKPAPGNEPWANVILHLAPADASGVANVCPWAGACKAACLNTAGRGQMNSVQQARIRRTKLYAESPMQFINTLIEDLSRFVSACRRHGYRPAARLNGTSDIAWWKHGVIDAFVDEIQFYDYTKRPPSLWPVMPGNYHLTYSHDPENDPDDLLDAISLGVNVAVVFDVKKSEPLPDTWGGMPVLDGRTHDYRFLDPDDRSYVVGLSALGKARGSAFATTPLTSIQEITGVTA